MKTPSKRIKQRGLYLLAALLVASLTIAAIPVSTVQASSAIVSTPQRDQPVPPPTGTRDPGTQLLEKSLARERKVNENLAKSIDKTDKLVTRLEEAIASGQENDRDVSALVAGLKALNQRINAAHIALDRAAGLLAHPAGFNQDGTVADRALATRTIREIHQIQQDVRRQIGAAAKDALQTVRDYQRDNAAD